MILRPSARPQTVLRSVAKPRFTRIYHGRHRSIHTVPELPPNTREFDRFGIPDFMDSHCFKLNWTKYMKYLCDELNRITDNTVDYNLSAIKLAEKYSHSAQHAHLFNIASMAVNNHWFFKTLSPTADRPSAKFLRDIEANFDNIDNLRMELLETANAMFGNGFVWLMKEHGTGNLRILATYNAGSPYPGAHHRHQSKDMASESIAKRLTRPSNTVGSFGALSRNAEMGFTNALKAEPILCVNVWQQAYLINHGITGKENYTMCWWERIDWEAVEQAAQDVNVRFPTNYGSTSLGNMVGSSMNRSRY